MRFYLLAMAACLAACASAPTPEPEPDDPSPDDVMASAQALVDETTSTELRRFESAEAFRGYLDAIDTSAPVIAYPPVAQADMEQSIVVTAGRPDTSPSEIP